MNFAEPVRKLIDERLASVNSVAVGVITKVNLVAWRADVRLKSKIQDCEIELANVPIGLQSFAAGAVHIAPAVGDVVIVGFSKHELQKQLRNRDVVAVNELVLHNINHAIILTGVYVETDAIPAVAAGEILIRHKSGSSIKFSANGEIEIYATKIRMRKRS